MHIISTMDFKLGFGLLLSFVFFFFSNGDPIVKTIQHENGDVFDCIDMKLQPAFQHPLLKNHKIQMKPSSYNPSHEKTLNNVGNSEAKIQSVSCPSGTIPIWRNYKPNETIFDSIKILQNQFMSQDPKGAEKTVTSYVAMTIQQGRFFGTKISTSIYEPDVKLGDAERTSGAWACLAHGENEEKNFDFMSAGWFVWPKYSSDKYSRFHIVWRPSDTDMPCINLLCPGFVQVSSDFALGSRFSPVSSYGGEQVELTIQITKDPKTENWMLFVGHNKLIGYWPKSLFPHMKKGAFKVGWGGLVMAPPTELMPAMGSGHFSKEGYKKAAYFSKIMVMDESNKFIVPKIGESDKIANNTGCYDVGNYGVLKDGVQFFFGGPSGCKG